MTSTPAPEYPALLPFRELVFDSFRQGHPLARTIHQTELDSLAQAWRTRLEHGGVRPGGWRRSVWGVREAAAKYARRAAQRGLPFTDADHLRVMRELTGHLGKASLRVSGGTWLEGMYLLEAAVGEEGNVVLRRGAEQKTVTRMALSVGYLAADVWHVAFSGSTEPIEPLMTVYVEYPDGHAEWQHQRMHISDGDDDSARFPSAWTADGL